MSNNAPTRLIVSEILCFIQSKMNTSEHDFMTKSLVSFYSEDAIHEAKILLFEECVETKLRLKTYRNDQAKHDCEDIVIKLNEVGSNCPRFVAANLNNVPITTSDAFDLAKLSMNIEHVLRLESDELLVLDADDEQEEPAPVLTKQKVVKQRTVRDHESKMTEGGFKLVGNSGKSSRTFTNSSLKHQQQAPQHGRSNK